MATAMLDSNNATGHERRYHGLRSTTNAIRGLLDATCDFKNNMDTPEAKATNMLDTESVAQICRLLNNFRNWQ